MIATMTSGTKLRIIHASSDFQIKAVVLSGPNVGSIIHTEISQITQIESEPIDLRSVGLVCDHCKNFIDLELTSEIHQYDIRSQRWTHTTADEILTRARTSREKSKQETKRNKSKKSTQRKLIAKKKKQKIPQLNDLQQKQFDEMFDLLKQGKKTKKP